MSFFQSLVIKAEVAIPRYMGALNFLSVILLAVAIFLPLISSLIVLVLSMLIQASFFRVMHREKAGVIKLLKRLAFLVISSVAILTILLQHRLL